MKDKREYNYEYSKEKVNALDMASDTHHTGN